MNKTKVMISEERQKVRQKAVRWPCGICSKGVGSNSLQCTICQKWVHKKCSGIKGSMSKVANSFIYRGCLRVQDQGEDQRRPGKRLYVRTVKHVS